LDPNPVFAHPEAVLRRKHMVENVPEESLEEWMVV
jgi:hypothetical protein